MVNTRNERSGSALRNLSPLKARRPARSPERSRPSSLRSHTSKNHGRVFLDTTLECADVAVGVLLLLLILMYIYCDSAPCPVVLLQEAAPTTALGTLVGFFKGIRLKPLWPLWG